MRALLLLVSAFLGSCGDASNEGDPEQPRAEAQNAADCPTADIFLTSSYPIRCSEDATGTICRYTAFACRPGEKPDNVCSCTRDGLICEGHLRSCLPVVEGVPRFTAESRPMPQHRAEAVTCVSPGTTPRDASCTPFGPSGLEPECRTSADCSSDEACLQRHVFGASSTCNCTRAECLDDGDCAGESLCHCGSNSPEAACGGPYYRTLCSNQCVAAECKTDSDCAGGWCSPSPNDCNSGFTHWACHDPRKDECLSDVECLLSNTGAVCRHSGQGWGCTSGPICD